MNCNGWVEKIITKIRHINLSSDSPPPPPPGEFFLFITHRKKLRQIFFTLPPPSKSSFCSFLVENFSFYFSDFLRGLRNRWHSSLHRRRRWLKKPMRRKRTTNKKWRRPLVVEDVGRPAGTFWLAVPPRNRSDPDADSIWSAASVGGCLRWLKVRVLWNCATSCVGSGTRFSPVTHTKQTITGHKIVD